MTHNRYEARPKHAPAASELVLGVRPIFLVALVLAGLLVLWLVCAVLMRSPPPV